MAFRGRSEWLGKEGAKFHTSEGKGRVDGNHSRPHWVSLEGSLDGQVCTVVAMGHPENFRHPEPTRLHPDKPYFVFSPSFLGAFERQKGVEYLARYRYCIADGAVSPDTANQWWEAYRQGKLPSPDFLFARQTIFP